MKGKKTHKKKAAKKSAAAAAKADGGDESAGAVAVAARHRDFSGDLETYVTTWANDKASWKFNKVLQNFILDHIFSADRIGKDLFRLLLPYIASIQGGARDRLLARVDKIVDGDDDDDDDDKEEDDAAAAAGADAPAAAAAAGKNEAQLKRAIKLRTALSLQ